MYCGSSDTYFCLGVSGQTTVHASKPFIVLSAIKPFSSDEAGGLELRGADATAQAFLVPGEVPYAVYS